MISAQGHPRFGEHDLKVSPSREDLGEVGFLIGPQMLSEHICRQALTIETADDGLQGPQTAGRSADGD